MKKKLLIVTSIVGGILLAGCGNKTTFDITYTFDKAILTLPNGEIIEGDVESWRDYEDGDQIQVKIDGVTYLVHSSDVVLIKED